MKGLNAYKKTAVITSDPMDLLVALYDGFLRRVYEAKAALEQKELGRAGEAIGKALAIVQELQVSLNPEADEEFTTRLSSIYEFVTYELLQANLKSDPSHLEAVLPSMTSLRDAWGQAAAQLRAESTKAQSA